MAYSNINSQARAFFSVHKSEFRNLLRNLCFYQKVWGMFHAVDVSADRRLDEGEVHKFLETLNSGKVQMTAKESKTAFLEMDEDQSGFVFFEEFCSWYARRSCPLPSDASAVACATDGATVAPKIAAAYEAQ